MDHHSTQQALNELDRLFIGVLEELANHARDHAAESARNVFNLSKGYLSENASNAMEDFFNIYFSDSEQIEKGKEEINKDVDDIFDEVQAIMDAGGDLSQLEDIQEDEELRDFRMGLSSVQKQLESIIRLEEGIREKLMPVMVSMQFEDAMNQRLDHIIMGWRIMMQTLSMAPDGDLQSTANQLSELPSSINEIELFYHEVMGCEVPAGRSSKHFELTDLF